MSNFSDVGDFHEKFDLHHTHPYLPGSTGAEADEELMAFRVKFLHEELEEFEKALAAGDRAGMFDALLDLVYVAEGTAHLLGFPWEAGWDRVQAANMAKERALPSGENSKRGSAWDVVKPEGWTAPDHSDLVGDPALCPGCGSIMGAIGCSPMRGRLGSTEWVDGTFCNARGRFIGPDEEASE